MPVKSSLPWEHYDALINWEIVAETIIGPDAEYIDQAQFRKIKLRVYSAAKYFVPLDMDCFEFVSTEAKYEVIHNSQQRKPDNQIIDLEAIIKPTACKPYSDYVGEKIIFDWKTTKSPLNHDWQTKCYDSWQWRRYAANRGAKLFEYRGLNWNNEIGLKIIEVPENINEQVSAFMLGLVSIKNHLVDSGLDIYPMNQPRACNAYNEKCAYKDDCEDFTMPRACLLDRSFSYSSDDKFLLCPERYRRDNLEPKSPEPTSESTLLGTCVHRGLESVYQQLMTRA